MNINEAKKEIINTVRAYLKKDDFGNYKIPLTAQRPLFLMGPAGIGKTAIMQQVAKECKINLVAYTITHHTRQSAIGLPFISEKKYGEEIKSITEYTMSEIIASVYNKIEETGISEGILFIDEINCVSETLAPTMLQFLQYKTFGSHKVPNGFIIVTAGNPPQFNKSVREFDIATSDRIRKINVLADLSVWLDYAQTADVHPCIISYLTAKDDHFYKTEKTANGLEFVTPRGWEDLSYILKAYEEDNVNITKDIISEYIKHKEISESFFAFYNLFCKYAEEYNVCDILDGSLTNSPKLKEADFDEKLVIINMLTDKLNKMFKSYVYDNNYTDLLYDYLKKIKENNPENIAEFIKNFISEIKREIYNMKKSSFTDEINFISKNKLLNTFEDYLNIFKSENIENNKQFEKIKFLFSIHIKNRENLINQISQNLDNAYSFMENTFETLREIVIFTTKLASGKNSFKFLSENKCEKYFLYSRELLFDQRQKELTEEIENYSSLLKNL